MEQADPIYTPVGEILTPRSGLNGILGKHPGVKMIVGGGVINGGVAMEFDAAIEICPAGRGFHRLCYGRGLSGSHRSL